MVLASIAKAIFGSANDRQVKKYQPKVDAINALEPAMAKLSDAELRAQDRRIPGPVQGRHQARRFAGARLRGGARGQQAVPRHASF